MSKISLPEWSKKKIPTEILMLHQKKGQKLSAAFGGRIFSYTHRIFLTPKSYPRGNRKTSEPYPREIRKTSETYTRVLRRAEKKKKTHALAESERPENRQNGPLKGRKRPFWAFFGLSRPRKGRQGYERVSEGFPKGSRRVGKASRRVWKAFEGS